ncbi:MAG: hypothetical protein ACOYOK_08555 [Pseudobdellovibrionaceae bacterium]
MMLQKRYFSQLKKLGGLLFLLALLSGCASHYKARMEQRDKATTASGLYCDFVNGDEYTDTDIELNLRVAKRCEAGEPPSLTAYKNASDNRGVIYCCKANANAVTPSKGKKSSEANSKESSPAVVKNSEAAAASAVLSNKEVSKPTNSDKAEPPTSDIDGL